MKGVRPATGQDLVACLRYVAGLKIRPKRTSVGVLTSHAKVGQLGAYRFLVTMTKLGHGTVDNNAVAARSPRQVRIVWHPRQDPRQACRQELKSGTIKMAPDANHTASFNDFQEGINVVHVQQPTWMQKGAAGRAKSTDPTPTAPLRDAVRRAHEALGEILVILERS